MVRDWSLGTIYKGMFEFMILQCIAIALVIAFPAIAIKFPEHLREEARGVKVEQIETARNRLEEDPFKTSSRKRGTPEGTDMAQAVGSVLQTTIAGSLPKPAWLAAPEKLWAPWLLEGEDLAEGKRDAVRLALADQEAAGIDIVSDGEQTRQHFVTTFIERLEGVDFQNKKTVRIRNRYDADVPVVTGAGDAPGAGVHRGRQIPALADLVAGEVHPARGR